MPQHASERKHVKTRSAKIMDATRKNLTMVRENVPVAALAGIAFGASYGHIVQLFGEYGLHGWVKYAAAATVDLLCIIGAEERQRDKRIGRTRNWGFVSWPTIVLIIGIGATLAANLATADPGLLGMSVAAWSAVALLLAVSILERRTSHSAVPGEASTRKASRRQAPEVKTSPAGEYQPAGNPVPAVPQPVPATVPAAGAAASITEPGERSDEELLRDARAYRDELAAKGERVSKEKLRLRFTIGSTKALELARTLREDEQDEVAI